MPDNLLPIEPVTTSVQDSPDFSNVHYPQPIVFPEQNQGVGQPLSNSDAVTDGFARLGAMKPDLSAPRTFDWDKSRAQMYVNSPHNKDLGFDPSLGKGNELKYADAQTGWDETKRGFGGAAVQFGQSFAGMVTNLRNLGSVFSDPTLQSSFKQDQLEELNRRQKEFDDGYHIFQGDNPTWYSHIAKGLQGTGGLLGALTEVAVSTAAIQLAVAGTGQVELEAAVPVELGALETELGLDAGALAQQGIKLSTRINNPSVIANMWRNVGEVSAKVATRLPVPGSNTVGYLMGDLLQGGEGGAIATAGRGFGAFANDINAINTATGFASGNAAATYQQMVSDQTERYKKLHGGDMPGYTDLQDIQDRAMKASKVDGAINAYMMLGLEKLAMGNILNSRATLQDAVNRSGRDIYERVRVKPSWAEDAETAPLYIKQQYKWNNFKANLFADYGAGIKSIGAKGLEFGAFNNAMAAVDKGVSSYYDALYDNKDISGMDAVRNGISSQFTKEGFNTFISGFLQGALVLGIGGAALGRGKDAVANKLGDWRAKATMTPEDFQGRQTKRATDEAEKTIGAQAFVDEVNDVWKNPLNPVKATVHDMVLQSAFAHAREGTLATNNLEDFHNIKDDADRQFIMKMMKNGLVDMWVDRMRKQGMEMGQEDLTKMMGVENTPENYRAIQAQIEELPNRVKDLKRISKTVEKELGSPFNPYAKDITGKRLYPDGSEEFRTQQNNKAIHDISKDYMVMIHDVAERTLIRNNELLNGNSRTGSTGILDMPFAKDMSYVDISTAMSPDLLQRAIYDHDQIINLGKGDKDAITEEAKYAKATTEAYKKELDKYLAKRKAILDKGAYPDREKDLQQIKADHKEELAVRMEKYLSNSLQIRNLKGKVIDRKPTPSLNDIRDGMDKMMDYYDLGMDHDRALDTLNLLLDPSIIKHFQMSFLREGTRRQMQEQLHVENLKAQMDKLKAFIGKLQSDLQASGREPTKAEKEKLADQQKRLDAVEAELRKLNKLPEEVVTPQPTGTTQLTDSPEPVTPEPPKPADVTPDTDAIRKSVHDWLADIGEQAIASEEGTAHTPVKLSPEADEYLSEHLDIYKAAQALRSQLDGIYREGDYTDAQRYINEFLKEHFDKDIEPLSYEHLPGSPKVTREGDKFTVTGIDKKFDTISEANKALQAKYPIYDIAGRKFQKGQYLYDDNGKQYLLKDRNIVIPTKGKSPKPLQVTDEQLGKYHDQKPEPKPGRPVMPDDKFKLANINEIVEVHPPGFTEEEMATNQVIIDKVLETLPKDQVSDYLSVVVTTNPQKADNTYDNELTKNNPYITINREPNTIAIYRTGKDQPIFYITHPNKYLFTDPFTGQVSSVPTREGFEYVYNLHGKPLDEMFNKWMENYNKSQQLAEVIDEITKQHGGKLSGVALDKYIKLSISKGSGAFIPRERSDEWPTVQQTIDSGKQLLAVYDQVHDIVVYGTKPHDVNPKEPNPYGGYVALWQLPDGSTQWTQMVTPSYTELGPEEFNTFVADYITKASQDIRQLNSEGKVEEAQAQAKLATAQLKDLFITQKPKSDNAAIGDTVVSFNLNMGAKGQVNVGYKIQTKGENGWAEDRTRHIAINSGVGIDKPATGEEFIRSLETKTNNYFKKHNIPPVSIGMDNVHKGYTKDEKGQISKDVVMASKITTSTDISSNYKVNYTVDKSGLYQVAPTNGKVTGKVISKVSPVSDIEANRGDIERRRNEAIKGLAKAIDGTWASNAHQQDEYGTTYTSGKIQDWFLDIKGTKEDAIQQIHAKYDAELKALEQKPEPVADETEGFNEDDIYELQQQAQIADAGYTPSVIEEQQIQELIDKHADDPLAIRKANRAQKVIEGSVSAHDIVNWDEFKADVARNLPDWVDITELNTVADNLRATGTTVGQFIYHVDTLRGEIQTRAENPYKYHEAFHGVYRILLTSEQQRQLLDEAHRVNPLTPRELAEFRRLYGDDKTADDAQEEWMADRFDAWKRDHKTIVPDGIRAWFQKLWNWIKELYNRFTGSQLEATFYKYNRGGYKHAKLQDNGYTIGSANDTALKLIETGTEEYTAPDGTKQLVTKYLDQNTGERLSSTIAALYHMEAHVSDHNKAELIKSILDNYRNTLNPDQQRYDDRFTDMYKADKVGAVQWDRRLNELYNLFNSDKGRAALTEAVDEHLKIMGYKQSLDDDKVLRVENEVGTRNYDTNADEIGGYESLQGAIREYIGSTVVPYTDEFGNSQMANGQPVYQAVDGAKVYNGLTQLLKNIPDIGDMVSSMMGAQYTGDTGAVITRLISDTGFQSNPDGWEVTKNPQLFIQFINGFRQASVDHIFVEAGTNGGLIGRTTRAYEANRQAGDTNQVSIWADAYDQLYQQGYEGATAKKTYAKEHSTSLKDLRDELLSGDYTDDTEFAQKAQELSNNIKEQVGMSIHPMAIQYSIAAKAKKPTPYMQKLLSTWKAEPIDPVDLLEIRNLMLAGKNPFIEAEARLRRIATTVGVFDDTVDSTNYLNAEGKNIYGFQKYNYVLEKGIQLNDSREIDKLRANPDTELCHLLTDNKWLDYPKKVAVVDGIALRFHNTQGEEIVAPSHMDTNQTDGSSAKHLNTRELNYMQYALAARGREIDSVWGTDVIPAIISDKSKLYLYNSPVIASVYIDKGSNLRITDTAMSKLYNIVQEEVARIDRVQKEIEQWTTPEDIQVNHIEDWHNGDLDGLKFDRAKQMLGDLINPDGTMKEEGLPKEYDTRRQIEKYFKGSIAAHMDQLVEQGLITPEHTNIMLPDYLWNGIPSRKGDGLNLNKENFEHNLSQIYLSNFINSDGFTHLLSPNGISTKRLSFWNADGNGSAKPHITAPELGIDVPFTDIHVATIEDPLDEHKFAYADSQSWLTVHGMRNWLWGQGQLTAKVAKALDKLESGRELTKEEVLGINGLLKTGNMLNPVKPVFYDGYTGLKMSSVMLTKGHVMVKGPDGKWIPDIRRMDLYKIWKTMTDHEQATGQPAMVTVRSASKLQNRNIAKDVNDLSTNHFNKLDANYLRKQLDNVDKGVHQMTKPTQPIWQIGAEQDDNTEVNGVKIGDIRNHYDDAVAQRMLVNHTNALNGLFRLSDGKPLDIGTTDLKTIQTTLGPFYDHMRDMLQATGANEQTLGFLQTRGGEPVYPALDFPATLEKYTQLVLNYLNKALYEKVPGIDATEMSSLGHNILREILEVDANGTPVPGKWRLIDEEYRKDPTKYQGAKTYTDRAKRAFSGLKAGDVIIDHLRANVPQFRDNKPTGEYLSEYLMPIAHIEDDGSMDSPAAKSYGVRIPYADKNSGSAGIRVGTLPVHLGSTRVGSAEEIRAKGGDNDLDKQKSQIYDLYSDGEHLHKYGSAVTDKDKFEEYLMYQATRNAQVKSQVKQLEATDEGLVARLLSTDRQLVITAMKNLKLPSTVSEFIEKGGENLNIGVLNNRELDAKMALAGNSHVATINLKPTSTDLLGNLVKPGISNSLYEIFNRKLTEDQNLSEQGKQNIQVLLRSFGQSDININEMRGQSDNADTIWTAKHSVGVAANGVPVLSFLMQHPMKVPGAIKFGGKTYNQVGGIHTSDGTRKFDVMMTHINTMTDNAKLDGLAAKLGLTREALSDAMTMNATGMDIDNAVLYMLQPAVKSYYKAIGNLRGTLKTFDESRQSKTQKLQEAIDSYGAVEPVELNRQVLENNIVQPSPQAELSALLDIQKTQALGNSLFNLARVMSLAANPPITWEDVDAIRKAIDDLYSKDSPIQLSKVHDQILDRYIQIFNQVEHLSPLLFIERDPKFKRLREIQDANMRPVRGSEAPIVNKQRKQDLISALSIAAMIQDLNKRGVDTTTLSNSLIYNDIAGKSIHRYIADAKKQLKGRKASYILNEFIRIVEKPGLSLLSSNNWAKLSERRQIQIRDSFMALPVDIRSTLFNYLLVKDGGQFKGGSFIKYADPVLFKDLLDATAKVKQALATGADAQELFGTDWNTVITRYITAQGLHIDNKQQLKYIQIHHQTHGQPVYRVGDQIHIDLFRGIPSGKLTPEHEAQLKLNIEDLAAVGFNMTDVPIGKVSKRGKIETTRHIALPYSIRSNQQVYRLQNTQIAKGQNTATGTTAIYVPTDTKGARNTFRAAEAIYGPVPYTTSIGIQPEQTVTRLPYSPDSIKNPTEETIQLQPQPEQPTSIQEQIKQQAEQGTFTTNIGGQTVQIDNKGEQVGFNEDEGYDEDTIMEMTRNAMPSEQPVVPLGDMQSELFATQTPVKNHAMSYRMPARDNLTGRDTSTVELAEQGIRIATTRSYPLGKVGDVITFENRPQKYRVTGVEQLTQQKVADTKWIQQWSQKEQWTPEYFKKVFGGSTVHIGSWQTSFERVGAPVVPSQQIDWKSEIDKLAQGRPEQFKDDARDTYKQGKGMGMTDDQILNAIKCL